MRSHCPIALLSLSMFPNNVNRSLEVNVSEYGIETTSLAI
jgi:hypothetical protein